MISDKLKNIAKALDLAADGDVTPPRKFFAAMAASLAAVSDQVRALESAQVPRRHRITPDQMAGNVRLFPVAPRAEARHE